MNHEAEPKNVTADVVSQITGIRRPRVLLPMGTDGSHKQTGYYCVGQ